MHFKIILFLESLPNYKVSTNLINMNRRNYLCIILGTVSYSSICITMN